MRLIDADALDMAFTNLRFNQDMSLVHWGDRKDWCLHGHEVEQLIHDAPTIGGWISVKDRLPEQGKTVLVARKYVQPGHKERRYVETAELIGTSWVSIEDEYKMHRQFHTLPYAWMPLPEPPKEEHDEP